MTQLNSLNPLNPFIPSPFNNPIQVPGSAVAPTASLHLTQIEGFDPPRSFVDSTNTEWTLAKAATNSTVGIPDPKGVQIIDCWNHKFPRDGLTLLHSRRLPDAHGPQKRSNCPVRHRG